VSPLKREERTWGILAALGAVALLAIVVATHWLAAWEDGRRTAQEHFEEAHGLECDHDITKR
jgi:hypothetical protein